MKRLMIIFLGATRSETDTVKTCSRASHKKKNTLGALFRRTAMLLYQGGETKGLHHQRLLFVCSAFSISLLLLSSCYPSGTQAVGNNEVPIDSFKLSVKYAKGFHVTYSNGYKLVDIEDPQNEKKEKFHFALVPKGGKHNDIPDGYTVIETPVERVICMTELQLSNFIKLDALDKVVGITSSRHLFNKEIRNQVKSGETVRIGMEGNFDEELIISASPEVVFISPFKRGGYDKLTEVSIPLVPHLGYKEMTPLAQAEWIKFVSLFVNKEKEANEKFEIIEKKYNDLLKLTANVKKRPVVFSGEIRGGNWYAVGGKSFLAQLFHDAGADYFLKNDDHTGGMNLDFETVYSQADKCEYWRILNSYEGHYSYNALKKSDPRYADFKAFKQKSVIYCNMKEHPYYEAMPMEPDVVLKDFIKAFHPELLPDYKPVYYSRLK